MATKQMHIKNRTYYFYNDLINIKNFDPNMLKLDKKTVLNNSVYTNTLYLMINRIKGHFEEKDGDKYLIISSENGDAIQKYQEVFDKLKEIIKKINNYSQPIKYDDNCMKIEFNTDHNILLNKIIYLPTINITKKMINIIHRSS